MRAAASPTAGAQRWKRRLKEVRPLEDFFAYPGCTLMKTLAERIASDDALGVSRLVRRMSGSLLSGSYRYDSGEWDTSDDGAPTVAGPPAARAERRRARPAVLRDPVRHRGAGRQPGAGSPRRSAACAASKTR